MENSSNIGSDTDLYLGLDCSTQTLKAFVIDGNLHEYPEFESLINYDVDLPHFNTRGGVHQSKDGHTVTTPTLVWVTALDLLLDRLKSRGLPFGKIAAVSGSGQQHGSVYWKKGAKDLLKTVDPARKLSDQCLNLFSVSASPIWMDSSTTKYCNEIESIIGGPEKLAELTGSVAYERFTVNQIRKISVTQTEAYNNTERISLVSSFLASLLIGDYAPIDVGDASGMNLMNIHTKKWVPEIAKFAAPDLEKKLGEPVLGHKMVGKVASYFVERYGFSPKCDVVAFTGDNPSSLAGLRLKEGDVAVSLGTSDTLFGPLSKPNTTLEGHVFCDPVRPDGYMALLCYKNGSLTREYIRDFYAYKDWTQFDKVLAETAPGNEGNIGFYFKDVEITPKAKAGITRFDGNDQNCSEYSANHFDVRGVVEGQFLSLLVHSQNIGLRTNQIFVTGGASRNPLIIQVLSNVFGVPVLSHTSPNSAASGAAFRALHAHKSKDSFVNFEDAVKLGIPFTKAAEPDLEAHKIYAKMASRYKALEQTVVSKE